MKSTRTFANDQTYRKWANEPIKKHYSLPGFFGWPSPGVSMAIHSGEASLEEFGNMNFSCSCLFESILHHQIATLRLFLQSNWTFENAFPSCSGSILKVYLVFFTAPCELLVPTMPDIAKSDISPNLDRDKMFSELWWLNYCFCEGVGIGAVGNPFFGGEAVNICLHSKCFLLALCCIAYFVIYYESLWCFFHSSSRHGDVPFWIRWDDWHRGSILLKHPCLPMSHGSMLFATSTRITNLRLLQQETCWWWWLEWATALWLEHKLWRHLLALLHLLHGTGLLSTSSQWPSSLCCTSEGAVHQGRNEVGCAHGRWQALFRRQHAPVLLGSMRTAAGWGSSHVCVLQLAEPEGGQCKAACIRIVTLEISAVCCLNLPKDRYKQQASESIILGESNSEPFEPSACWTCFANTLKKGLLHLSSRLLLHWLAFRFVAVFCCLAWCMLMLD